jgi:hypothetical protein
MQLVWERRNAYTILVIKPHMTKISVLITALITTFCFLVVLLRASTLPIHLSLMHDHQIQYILSSILIITALRIEVVCPPEISEAFSTTTEPPAQKENIYIVACFPCAGTVEARSLKSGMQQKENQCL